MTKFLVVSSCKPNRDVLHTLISRVYQLDYLTWLTWHDSYDVTYGVYIGVPWCGTNGNALHTLISRVYQLDHALACGYCDGRVAWLVWILGMEWLRLVGPLKLWVSFAKEPYKTDDILQKRPIILRSLLIVATPYLSLCLALCLSLPLSLFLSLSLSLSWSRSLFLSLFLSLSLLWSGLLGGSVPMSHVTPVDETHRDKSCHTHEWDRHETILQWEKNSCQMILDAVCLCFIWCVAVCCSLLQCSGGKKIAAKWFWMLSVFASFGVLQSVAVCCSAVGGKI